MNYNISLIPGDGIGPEIVAEAKKVLEALRLEGIYKKSKEGSGQSM